MEDNKDTKVEEQEVVKEETTKTYTQEDIDNSFKAGVKKANQELQKDEKYKEFLKWKETSKTDNDKINELQASNELLIKENKLLKATNNVAKSDAKPEFIKFITNEVMELVDENTDFDTALNNFKKENPQYFGEVVVKKVQSSPTLNNGGKQPNTINDIFNKMIRDA